MAVQAQYPSNVLLLNRNVQEPKNDYSLQPQPGGFLDQSSHHMLFNNGGAGSNPRKRGRDLSSSSVAAAAAATAPMNPFSLQPQNQPQLQHPQLVDLTQLHNHQQNVVYTGLHLAFGDQQQQQQLQQQHQQQQQQQSPYNSHNSSSVLSSLLSEDIANQIKQQRDEIDEFLQAQGEQLRRTLAEKRQRQYRALLGAAEESVARRLREKEAEVEKAARRHAELEARAAQLSMEAQVWQSKARAQEATAASLQAQLQQAIMSGGCAQQERRGGEEGLGCAEGGVGQAEDAESGYIDPDRVESATGRICKTCRRRVASVVVLPCRHLCLCTECDAVAHACPICLSIRKLSVEVFLS